LCIYIFIYFFKSIYWSAYFIPNILMMDPKIPPEEEEEEEEEEGTPR
jgi:hypothetical protein